MSSGAEVFALFYIAEVVAGGMAVATVADALVNGQNVDQRVVQKTRTLAARLPGIQLESYLRQGLSVPEFQLAGATCLTMPEIHQAISLKCQSLKLNVPKMDIDLLTLNDNSQILACRTRDGSTSLISLDNAKQGVIDEIQKNISLQQAIKAFEAMGASAEGMEMYESENGQLKMVVDMVRDEEIRISPGRSGKEQITGTRYKAENINLLMNRRQRVNDNDFQDVGLMDECDPGKMRVIYAIDNAGKISWSVVDDNGDTLNATNFTRAMRCAFGHFNINCHHERANLVNLHIQQRNQLPATRERVRGNRRMARPAEVRGRRTDLNERNNNRLKGRGD